MNILILGINFSPEIISTAVYTTGLADYLDSAEDDVSVVTAHPYYPEWKIRDGFPRFFYRSDRRGRQMRITHCPHYVPQRPTGMRRILHHASFALTAAPAAIWRAVTRRPDVVVVVAPALLSAPVGWAVARLTGAKCWLHVQDFEVEAAFATGLIDGDSRIARLARRFESWILRRFDRVSSISEPMIRKLLQKGVPRERIVSFPNWANLDRVAPLTGPSPYREEFGITTPHVVQYSGNIANKQGLEILPQVARLLAHRDDVTFAIVGQGPFLPQLRQLAEGVDNIRFFPLQPVERLGELQGMATVHLLPQIAGAADLVLPSKLCNMLASGRPVVTTAMPDTALALAVQGCGAVVPPGDAEAVAAAVERLLDQPDHREICGRAARKRALDTLDANHILRRIRLELRHLAGRGAPPSDPAMVEVPGE